jgi:FkbM family methyltransferase
VKGRWLANLLLRVSEGAITPREAIAFLMWRLTPRPRPLKIAGIQFHEIDRATWGIIAGIILNREYNPPGFEIGSEDVVVDIGAHRGVFLAHVAAKTHGPVVGVEPDPENFRALGLLIRSNRMENVELVNAAVARTTGKSELFQANSSSRHSLTGIDVVTGKPLPQSLTTNTISLDDLCLPYRTIHFMKMDCEGAEHAIVLSAHDDTLRKIERLVLEVHDLASPQGSEPLLERLGRSFRSMHFRRTSGHLGVLYARRG